MGCGEGNTYMLSYLHIPAHWGPHCNKQSSFCKLLSTAGTDATSEASHASTKQFRADIFALCLLQQMLTSELPCPPAWPALLPSYACTPAHTPAQLKIMQ